MVETLLHKLRIRQNLSQSELAKLSGVNYRTLQDFEQGRKSLLNAKGEMIYRLCRALKCDFNILLADSTSHINIEVNDTGNALKRIKGYHDRLNKAKLYSKYYKFPVVVNDNHIDMSRIYPTKQLQMSRLYEALYPYTEIVSVMLFGSSVTMQCNKDSDTDLSVRLRDDCITNDVKNSVSQTIQEVCEWKADILWFDRISSNDRVYHEICKGVQIL